MKNNLILFKRFLSFICSILIFISVFSGTGLTVCAAMVTRGGTINYSSYIPGSNWQTHYYYVDGHLAYCVQSELAQVNDGDYGTIIETFDTYPLLCKVLFYGYGGPAYKMGEFFSQYGITLTEEQAYLYTHIAANYAYGGNVWHGLDASTAEALHLTDWIVYCSNNVCLPENKHLTGGIVKIATPAGAQRVAYLDSFTFEPISVSVEVKFNFDKTKNTYGDATTNDAVYGIFDSADTELQRITLSTPAGSSTASGDFTYVFSNSGTYYVKEITAPMGYTLDTTKYYFTVDTSGQSATSSDVHFSSVNSKELSFTQNDETPVKGRFTFTKKDSSGNPLSGAGFDVYLKSFLPVNADGYDYSAATPVCGRLSSDASGTVTSPDLEYGTYVVHEAVVPEGKLPVADFEVGIDTNDIVLNVEDKIDNLIQGRFSFVKKDEKGNSLAGAGFDVYLKSSLPITDGSYDFDAATPICLRLTSDESGVVTSPLLDYGTYIVHEAVIPEGKLPIDDFEVSVLSGAELSLGDKVDKNIKGRFHFLKTDNQGNPLSGAGFDVYLKKDLTVSGGQYDFSSANPVCSRLESDTSGIVNSPELDYGTYVVHESVVPKGMLPIADFEVSVTSDGSNQNLGIKSDKTIQGKFTFIKKDSDGNPLSGAGFDVYLKSNLTVKEGKYDFSSATPVCSRLTSAKDGSVTSPLLDYGTYVVHETVVPEGKQAVPDFEVEINKNGTTVNVEDKTDKIIQGRFHFVKTDDKGNPLSGAKFDVYLKSDLTVLSGKYDFLSAKPVCSGLTSAADGTVTSPLLDYGTYIVHESVVPKGKLPIADFEVSITSDGKDVDLGKKTDKTIQGKFTFLKKDSDGNPLSGAGFDVYLKSNLTVKEGKYDFSSATPVCSRLTSDKDGKINSPLLDYGIYVVHEAVVPEGKLAVSDFEVEINKNGTTVNVEDKIDKTIQGRFNFVKKDDKGNPLSGAGFDVYLKSELTVSNGKYVFTSAKPVCSRLTSAKDGMVTSPLLDYGTYIVHEAAVPEGMLPIEDFEISVTTDGSNKDLGIKTDKNIRGKFSLKKAGDDGRPVEGAGFSAYKKSSLTKNADGTYDFSSATPVIITSAGGTVLKTDSKGKATSGLLDYGTYVICETVVPKGYKACDPFEVKIEKDSVTVDIGDVTNAVIPAKFRIIKKDSESGETILKPGAKFKIYDVINNVYVSVGGEEVFITDDTGTVTTKASLPLGTYRIEEIEAPEGYLLNSDKIEIVFDSMWPFSMEESDKVITAEIENTPKRGRVELIKTGKGLTGFENSKFVWTDTNLSGAVYEIHADEDIYSSDNSGILIHAKDDLIGTVTTDSKGKASMDGLYLGKYYLTEVTAPTGYVIDKTHKQFELSYNNSSETPVISTNSIFDEKQNIVLYLTKTDSETGKPLSGAEFGICAKKDIYSFDGKLLVSGGELIATALSDQNGKVDFGLDLPYGEYIIREIKAPLNYVISKKEFYISAVYPESSVKEVSFTYSCANTPVRGSLEITKIGETLSEFKNGEFIWENRPLKGAKFNVIAKEDIYTFDNALDTAGKRTLYFAKNQIIETIETDTNGKAKTSNLPVGKYYLVETNAPYGMILDTAPIDFSIEYKNQNTSLVLSQKSILNERQKITLQVTKSEIGSGKKLSGGKFNLYADDDIKNCNGDVIVPKGTIISSAEAKAGVIDFGPDLPHSVYKITEEKAPSDYYENNTEYEIDLSYTDPTINNQTADLSIFDTRLAHFAKVMMRIKPVFKSKSKSNYITEDNGENGYSILLVSDGSALPVSTAYNTWFCLFVSSILLVAGSLLTVFYLIKRRKVMKEKERSRYE